MMYWCLTASCRAGCEACRPHDHRSTRRQAAHDGRQLASGSDDKIIKIWDTATGELQHILEGHGGAIRSVAFAYNSRQLASGSDDEIIKIWDTATGALQHTLKGHGGAVTSVAFSYDSRQLASGSRDETIKIWDTATGALLLSGQAEGEAQDRGWFRSSTTVQLQPGPQPHAQTIKQFYGYDISPDKIWIRRDGHNVLWLPPDYRPFVSAISPSVVVSGGSL